MGAKVLWRGRIVLSLHFPKRYIEDEGLIGSRTVRDDVDFMTFLNEYTGESGSSGSMTKPMP